MCLIGFVTSFCISQQQQQQEEDKEEEEEEGGVEVLLWTQ